MKNTLKFKNIFLISLILVTVLSSTYIFISTVYELQFTNSNYFKNQALSYRVKINKLHASRGNIYDKNLILLTSSTSSFNIGIFPNKVNNLDEVSIAISVILDLDEELVYKRLTTSDNFFYLDRNVDYETGLEIDSWNIDGILA